VPCGISGIRLGSVDITPDPARCLKAAAIPAAVDAAKGALALLPAGRGRLARGTRVAAILLGPMAG
jgi:hypothetical protein